MPWFLIVALGAITVMVVGTAFWAWRTQSANAQHRAEKELAAIGELKASEISSWLRERRGDAEILRNDPFLAEAARHSFADPADRQARRDLQTALSSVRDNYHVTDAVLADRTLTAQVSSWSTAPPPLTATDRKLAAQALATDSIVVSDLRQDAGGSVHIKIAAPLSSSSKGDPRPPGVVVMTINPDDYLYPLIQRWPTDSASGETLLIERQGDEVVYLNNLRFQRGAALQLRLPLSNPDLPAAKALRGETGNTAGVDYRGVDVLAYSQMIAGTDWAIVAKLDRQEVLGDIIVRGWVIVGISLLVLIAITLGVLLAWRSREARAAEALRDVNAQLEQRVFERTANLEAAVRELEAFSYSVAHDLRQPLRAMSSFGQILFADYGPRLDDEGRSHLDRIINASQRMSDLIDELLALTQLGRHPLDRQLIDLSEMARLSAADLQSSHPEHNVDCVIEDGLTATADPHLVQLVLSDLLENAWKFTANRDPAHVEFGAMNGDGTGDRSRTGGHRETGNEPIGETVFFVRDDGVGFDMAHADKLFGTFERLHTVDEFEGTGIGLSTVDRLVRRHGGRVWAEAEVDKGATFFFTLPEPSPDA